jgi:mannitol/fructose-specific phosphotransferase system IIA component (Ntr-type)
MSGPVARRGDILVGEIASRAWIFRVVCMELSRILSAANILVPIRATDKTGVITELVELLAANDPRIDRGRALEAVLKREADRTTGIGYGLAIPHGRSEGCPQLAMAAGKPLEPIDFQSIDRRPVTFVVLLVSPPDQAGPHIQALAKISRLMNHEGFREAVMRAASAQELHHAIAAYEAGEH